MKNIYNLNKYLTFLIIIVISWSYINNLGGDLSYLKRLGDFGDEGYWLQNPISKIKFGTFLIDDQSQSFFGAPIYNYSIYFFLKYFGISFFTARLTSIIFLILTCFVVFKILLKLNFNKHSSIIASVSFILLYDNRINYQWSTPVPLEIFFQSLFIYHVMFNKLISYKNITNLIFLCLLCYNSKATSIFLIPLSIVLITIDNFRTHSWLKKSLYFIIPILFFFFLRNFFFDYYLHDKYQSFNKFLFTTIDLNFKRIIANLNPYYLIVGSIQTFKFPNSTLIYTVVIFTILTNLNPILNLNIIKSYISNNRALFILILYIIFYIVYLISINSYGADRRQINLILPFYVLFVIFLPTINLANHRVLFLFLFISMYSVQARQLYNQLHFDFNITLYKIFMYTFLLTILFLSCLAIYYKNNYHILLVFIITNLSFHLVFNRNSETLRIANHSIATKVINNPLFTGVNAHHLSIENNFIPIWWLDTTIHKSYPGWNSNYQLFRKNTITVVATDMRNNLTNGYFKSIPINYDLFRSDTIYLYPKIDNSGYLDTTIVKYYCHTQ